MSSVGLLYVGAVLCINGLMLLGLIPAKAAAAMNLFVGGMQVVFPTIILVQSGGDPAIILGASGLFLFGFTYLYVAWNALTGASGEGLGWFSLFVACCAVVYGILQFTTVHDPVFGMIWFSWAALWLLFFLLLALGKDSLDRWTGWFALFLGVATGAVPAFLLLTGAYRTGMTEGLIAGVILAVLFVVAAVLGRRSGTGPGSAPAAPAETPRATTV
ncbi:transporter [Leucobacter sp. CSA2]|uniref:Transporter n=1 Tax=Leucobacter edaphi TaxID=2796472 RepID=A0A934Q9V9_9MICO|nr:AmiS/UreI family transporter [Leucobacter edaphi]MBK0420824.1 transporter [Leucobacter edaphi]